MLAAFLNSHIPIMSLIEVSSAYLPQEAKGERGLPAASCWCLPFSSAGTADASCGPQGAVCIGGSVNRPRGALGVTAAAAAGPA